jgi:hypothetical protein
MVHEIVLLFNLELFDFSLKVFKSFENNGFELILFSKFQMIFYFDSPVIPCLNREEETGLI